MSFRMTPERKAAMIARWREQVVAWRTVRSQADAEIRDLTSRISAFTEGGDGPLES